MPTRRLLAIVLACLWLSACGRRAGMNFECAWVPDPAFRIDVRDESHVRHLLEDIRAAEELAVRYGDQQAGWRLVETFGIVSRHGGVKNGELGRQSRQQCVATLFSTIASAHGIAVADIERVRPQLAHRGFDPAVTIPVALLFVFALRRFLRWIRNRFETDEWMVWALATLFASAIIPAVVLTIGAGWAAAVEVVRLGNEHIGQRARMEGLRANFLIMLGIGFAAVWIGSAIAAIRKGAEVSTVLLE